MTMVTDMISTARRQPRAPLRLTTFFLLVFMVSWLGVLPVVLASWIGAEAIPAPLKLLQILMILGPGLVALWATWREGGREAIFQLLRGLIQWRVNWRWYGAVLLGPAVIFGLSLWASYATGLTERSFYPFSLTFQIFLSTMVSYLLLNTEEVAWRGYALPRLQTTMGPLGASLVLWGVGMLFHLPLFLLRGGHPAGYPFLVWALLFLGLTLIFTWVFNGTQGSLLLVHLLHQSINAWIEAIPLYPVVTQSIAPIGFAIGLLVIVAGVYVWIFVRSFI
jgi:membrane protease YdiL (CAAX protease family)